MKDTGAVRPAGAHPPLLGGYDKANPVDIYFSDVEKNRVLWERKPALQHAYRKLYGAIASRLAGGPADVTLELGSGIGHSKDVMPQCVTSDTFPAPWLDRVESAYRISYTDGAVTNLILFDVWHHLEFPLGALNEFSRVVRSGGRVILLEPAVGLLGLFVYGLFHKEPLGLMRSINMAIPAPGATAVPAPYAAVANCWRMFRRPAFREGLADWKILEVRRFSALAYLGTGGYSGPQLLPQSLLPVAYGMEKILDYLPLLFAIRMIVVLERK